VLEASRRARRRVVAGITVLTLCGLLTGCSGWPSARFTTVTAERFALADKNNRLRADLYADGDETNLILIDATGRQRAVISIGGNNNESYIALIDESGITRSRLHASGNSVGLNLLDQAGKNRMQLHAGGDEDNSVITIARSADEARLQLFETTRFVGMRLLDSGGQTRITIITSEDKDVQYSYVAVLGDDGKPVWAEDARGKRPASKGLEVEKASKLMESLRKGWLEALREIDGDK
jgi:hypothetical protein